MRVPGVFVACSLAVANTGTSASACLRGDDLGLPAWARARIAEAQQRSPGLRTVELGLLTPDGIQHSFVPAPEPRRAEIWQITATSIDPALTRAMVGDEAALTLRAVFDRYAEAVGRIVMEADRDTATSRRMMIRDLDRRLQPPGPVIDIAFDDEGKAIDLAGSSDDAPPSDPGWSFRQELVAEERAEYRRLRADAVKLARSCLEEVDAALADEDPTARAACIGRMLIRSLTDLRTFGGRHEYEFEPPDVGELVEVSVKRGALARAVRQIEDSRGALDALELRTALLAEARAFDAEMAPRVTELFLRDLPEPIDDASRPRTSDDPGFFAPFERMGADWSWRQDISSASRDRIAAIIDAWLPGDGDAREAWLREWIGAACEDLGQVWFVEGFLDWLEAQPECVPLDLAPYRILVAEARGQLLAGRLDAIDVAVRYCRRSGSVLFPNPRFAAEFAAYCDAMEALASLARTLGVHACDTLPAGMQDRARSAMAGARNGPFVRQRTGVEPNR